VAAPVVDVVEGSVVVIDGTEVVVVGGSVLVVGGSVVVVVGGSVVVVDGDVVVVVMPAGPFVNAVRLFEKLPSVMASVRPGTSMLK
jgi:hypothetical protein